MGSLCPGRSSSAHCSHCSAHLCCLSKDNTHSGTHTHSHIHLQLGKGHAMPTVWNSSQALDFVPIFVRFFCTLSKAEAARVYVSMCVLVCLCECVCVCVFGLASLAAFYFSMPSLWVAQKRSNSQQFYESHTQTHTHSHKYTGTCIYTHTDTHWLSLGPAMA